MADNVCRRDLSSRQPSSLETLNKDFRGRWDIACKREAPAFKAVAENRTFFRKKILRVTLFIYVCMCVTVYVCVQLTNSEFLVSLH